MNHETYEFTKQKMREVRRKSLRRLAFGVAGGVAAFAVVMVVNGDVLRAGMAAAIFGCVAAAFVQAIE